MHSGASETRGRTWAARCSLLAGGAGAHEVLEHLGPVGRLLSSAALHWPLREQLYTSTATGIQEEQTSSPSLLRCCAETYCHTRQRGL
ncbi:hypothetical protein PsYK624_156330 [Phanerochaete sordida]|uniref:Uncharacterized protein n=1 Tax=Phanerochaete sordida TaxID=48140 RepID=A0A9P3GTG3_9APHY|nr:hypothetical protein PsYK624_156330 [Phanerochaete sordida]